MEADNPVASVAQPSVSSSELSTQQPSLSGKRQCLYIDLGVKSTSLFPWLQYILQPLLYMHSLSYFVSCQKVWQIRVKDEVFFYTAALGRKMDIWTMNSRSFILA